jgi:hypothetical protein
MLALILTDVVVSPIFSLWLQLDVRVTLLLPVVPFRTHFGLSVGPTEITTTKKQKTNDSLPNVYHYSKTSPSVIRVSAGNIISRDIDTVFRSLTFLICHECGGFLEPTLFTFYVLFISFDSVLVLLLPPTAFYSLIFISKPCFLVNTFV